MFGRNQFDCVSTDHGRNRLITVIASHSTMMTYIPVVLPSAGEMRQDPACPEFHKLRESKTILSANVDA